MNKLNVHVSNQFACGSKPLRTLLPDAFLWDWIFNENKGVFVPLWQACLVAINKFTSTCSARLVNVKGLAAFPCVGVKRSVDLSRR